VERIADALDGSPGAIARLAGFGRSFQHAHNPLGPALASLGPRAGLAPVAAFSLVSALATLVAWRATRALAGADLEVADGATARSLLLLAFFGNALVVRSFARPITDATGLACTALSLVALVRWIERPGPLTAAALLVAQSTALAARLSCIPLLAMPALGVLLARPSSGDPANPGRRLVTAAFAFGLLPAVVVFGAARLAGFEHLARVWRFAHRESFASSHTPQEFVRGFVAAGGLLLVVGGLARGNGRSDVRRRIALAWACLYLAFLAAGRAALWPRYFLPVLPAAVALAARPLATLARERFATAAMFASVAVATTWLATRPAMDDLGTAADRLARGGLAACAPDASAGRALRLDGSVLVASENGQAADHARDGRAETGWSTLGPVRAGTTFAVGFERPRPVRAVVLRSHPQEDPERLEVDLSDDGERWHSARLSSPSGSSSGFFDRGPGTTLAFEPEQAKWVRVRAGVDGKHPWSIREIEIRGSLRDESDRDRALGAPDDRRLSPGRRVLNSGSERSRADSRRAAAVPVAKRIVTAARSRVKIGDSPMRRVGARAAPRRRRCPADTSLDRRAPAFEKRARWISVRSSPSVPARRRP
jgi:hypothetical protein